ncbi:hypothetical protein L7F22_059832 [Adiantum nelumboides]|nr:hypothetical protein [Adiantum nelumboides]
MPSNNNKPVAQFAVKMNQLLLRADPTMSEEMKLFFLWPRLRRDISRRVRDQGPTSFHTTIQVAQRIEGAVQNDAFPALLPHPTVQRPTVESHPVPMGKKDSTLKSILDALYLIEIQKGGRNVSIAIPMVTFVSIVDSAYIPLNNIRMFKSNWLMLLLLQNYWKTSKREDRGRAPPACSSRRLSRTHGVLNTCSTG